MSAKFKAVLVTTALTLAVLLFLTFVVYCVVVDFMLFVQFFIGVLVIIALCLFCFVVEETYISFNEYFEKRENS